MPLTSYLGNCFTQTAHLAAEGHFFLFLSISSYSLFSISEWNFFGLRTTLERVYRSFQDDKENHLNSGEEIVGKTTARRYKCSSKISSAARKGSESREKVEIFWDFDWLHDVWICSVDTLSMEAPYKLAGTHPIECLVPTLQEQESKLLT